MEMEITMVTTAKVAIGDLRTDNRHSVNTVHRASIAAYIVL
jgi:hypothetical protein